MTEVNLTPEQEAAAKLEQEGKTDVKTLEERLAKQEETIANLNKGIEKLATKLNQGKGDDKEGDGKPALKPEQSYSKVVKNLYIDKNPEITTVWDEVVEEANALGQDPIDYYESKKGWQLEAKARVEIERKKQETKDLLDFPEGKPAGDERIDFSKISPEQISRLSSKQRENYRDYLRRQNPLEMKRVE